jgi:hypothetical protein
MQKGPALAPGHADCADARGALNPTSAMAMVLAVMNVLPALKVFRVICSPLPGQPGTHVD